MSEIEFGDEKAVPKKASWGETKKFKGKKGKTERIYLIEDKAVAEWVHFFVKGYFKCLAERTSTESGVEVNKATCPLCVRVEELYHSSPSEWKGSLARLRIGTNVIYYSTDKKGDLLDPYVVENRLWVIDQQKFADLGSIKREWGPLQNYDLKIDCKDDKFQKINIVNCAKAACRQDQQVWERTCQEYETNRYDVARELGRSLNRAEMEDAIEDLEAQYNEAKENSGGLTQDHGSRRQEAPVPMPRAGDGVSFRQPIPTPASGSVAVAPAPVAAQATVPAPAPALVEASGLRRPAPAVGAQEGVRKLDDFLKGV